MNYFKRLFLFIGFSLIVLGLVQVPVGAEESDSITDVQMVKIRSQCTDLQSTLNRVHVNDALLRVNRGQLYELLSTKLMARLNSRIALNRLDSTKLVAASTVYEQYLREFRANYQAYEEALSGTIKTNCVNQPVGFYDQLRDVRAKRLEVFKSTEKLESSIQAYKDAFDEFKQPYIQGPVS